jgi:MFS family permease
LRQIVPISALIAGSGFLMFAGGMNGLILPLRGEHEGFSAFGLGLLGSAWAIGYVSGCVLVPGLVRHAGHIRAFSAMAALAAISVLGSLLLIHIGAWIVTRLICGFCFSGAAMIVESWLNEDTRPDQRGRVFAVLMMVNLVATTAGNLVIMAGDGNGYVFFVAAAIFYCMALLPTAMTSSRTPAPLVQARLNLPVLWRNSPYAVVAIVLVGVSNGAFGTLGVVYAARIGLPVTAITMFMAFALLAGALFQLPVGFASDRFDRRMVLLALAVVAACTEAFFVFARPAGTIENLAAAAVFGGAVYAMYPVIVAHANDRAEPGTFLQVSGGLLLLFGAGAIAGPAICGIVMTWYGPVGLFTITLCSHVCLIAYGVKRLSFRAEIAHEYKVDFVQTSPARLATPESAVLDPRTGADEIPVADSPALQGKSERL